MRKKEEKPRRKIDRIALQQSMETFRPSKISFIKQIKGVEVLEVTSNQLRETGTTDRISHPQVKSKIYIKSQLILIGQLVKLVHQELLQSNSNNKRTGIMLRVNFRPIDSQCQKIKPIIKTKGIFQMVLEGITIHHLKVHQMWWLITLTMSLQISRDYYSEMVHPQIQALSTFQCGSQPSAVCAKMDT